MQKIIEDLVNMKNSVKMTDYTVREFFFHKSIGAAVFDMQL